MSLCVRVAPSFVIGHDRRPHSFGALAHHHPHHLHLPFSFACPTAMAVCNTLAASLLLLYTCSLVSSFIPLYNQNENRITSRKWESPPSGDFFDELGDDDHMSRALEDGDDRVSWEELAESAEEWDERIAQFNRVIMVGRVGNDPDPRYFDDGNVVLNLSLAVRRKYHALERKACNIKTGEEETDWYGLEIWGRDAEYAAKYVTKGARIGVVGSLQLDEWTDKATGEHRNSAKIIVKDLDILETKAESELRQANKRGPSFYTYDADDEDQPATPFDGGSGGFFD